MLSSTTKLTRNLRGASITDSRRLYLITSPQHSSFESYKQVSLLVTQFGLFVMVSLTLSLPCIVLLFTVTQSVSTSTTLIPPFLTFLSYALFFSPSPVLCSSFLTCSFLLSFSVSWPLPARVLLALALSSLSVCPSLSSSLFTSFSSSTAWCCCCWLLCSCRLLL